MSSHKRYFSPEKAPWVVRDRQLSDTVISTYPTRTAAREAATKLNIAWREKVAEQKAKHLEAAE